MKSFLPHFRIENGLYPLIFLGIFINSMLHTPFIRLNLNTLILSSYSSNITQFVKSLSDVSKLLLYVLILLYNYCTIPYYGISLLHLPRVCVFVSRSVVSDSLQPHRLQLPRLLCPRNFPRNNTGAGCHALLHGIFLTQGLNPGLLHCGHILYRLILLGSPINLKKLKIR